MSEVEHITGVLYKKSKADRLGIFIAQEGPHAVIHAVQGQTQQRTDLVPRLRVVQVNGVPILAAAQALTLLRDAPAGEVFIVAEGCVRKAHKHRAKDKAGITLQQVEDRNDLVRITKVSPDGLFPTLPTANQILVAVNGHTVTSAEQALKLLKEKELTIVTVNAQQFEEPSQEVHIDSSSSPEKFQERKANKRGNRITGVVYKAKPESQIGISFLQQQNHVLINNVWGQVQEKTHLAPRLKILQINGESVTSVEDAESKLQKAPVGQVVLVAEGQCFIAQRQVQNEKVGFTIRKVGAEVSVVKVDPNGLIPGVHECQELISINGTPVRSMNQAYELLKAMELTVVVRDPLSSRTEAPSSEDNLSLLIEIVSCRDLLIGDVTASDPYVKIMLGREDLHKTKHLIQT